MSIHSEERSPDLAAVIARSIADILRPYLTTRVEAELQQVAETRSERSAFAHERAHSTDDALGNDLAYFDTWVAEVRSALVRHDAGAVMHSTHALSARFVVPAPQPHAGTRPIQDHLLAQDAAGDRVAGGESQDIGPEAESVGTSPSHARKSSELGESFSVVADEYLRLRGKDREEGMRGQTINQNKATFRMFVEVNGDLPFKSVVREHTSAFLAVLEQLACALLQIAEMANSPLQELAAAPKPKGTAMLAKKTQGRHFAALGGLFKHLISRKGYAGANPALGFGLKPKRKARKERPAWTPEDLAQLFGSPIWTGCVSERRRSTPGNNIYRNAMYWLPILCVFHGARLEEFAQLRRRDVRQEDGIWYFNVTDEAAEGQLKNEQSRRQVPLHQFGPVHDGRRRNR